MGLEEDGVFDRWFLHSFVWTIALMVILVYCFGVFITQLVADRLHRQDAAKSAHHADLSKYYGSILSSMLSLFQAITGGVDWDDVMTPLQESISPSVSVLFVSYVAFAVLVLLNLVTGVFVEGAQRIIREDREAEQVRLLCTLLRKSDLTLETEMDFHDFMREMGNAHMEDFFDTFDFTRDEVETLFELLDRDGNGSLTLTEFVLGCQRLTGPARIYDIQLLHKSHRSFVRSVENHIARVEKNFQGTENGVCSKGNMTISNSGEYPSKFCVADTARIYPAGFWAAREYAGFASMGTLNEIDV